MPKPKEHKETVTYPPSKRKPPPFKPQRPSKLSRTATTESERSDSASNARASISRTNSASTSSKAKAPVRAQDQAVKNNKTAGKNAPLLDLLTDTEDEVDIDSDILPDEPFKKTTKLVQGSRHEQIHEPSFEDLPDDADIARESLPPDIDESATIPQPLLLRLMHEHFISKDTKIDKHAIVVLQKYLDVFVRETIARAALSKKDDVDSGRASQSDIGWLDRQDLEKVAGSMFLDF